MIIAWSTDLNIAIRSVDAAGRKQTQRLPSQFELTLQNARMHNEVY